MDIRKKSSVMLQSAALAMILLPNAVFAKNVEPATVPDANAVMSTLGSNESVNKVTNTLKGVFGSVYGRVMAIGIVLLVISLVGVAISLATSGNGGKREESKGRLIWICVAGIGLGAVLTIATAALQIGNSIGG